MLDNARSTPLRTQECLWITLWRVCGKLWSVCAERLGITVGRVGFWNYLIAQDQRFSSSPPCGRNPASSACLRFTPQIVGCVQLGGDTHAPICLSSRPFGGCGAAHPSERARCARSHGRTCARTRGRRIRTRAPRSRSSCRPSARRCAGRRDRTRTVRASAPAHRPATPIGRWSRPALRRPAWGRTARPA